MEHNLLLIRISQVITYLLHGITPSKVCFPCANFDSHQKIRTNKYNSCLDSNEKEKKIHLRTCYRRNKAYATSRKSQLFPPGTFLETFIMNFSHFRSMLFPRLCSYKHLSELYALNVQPSSSPPYMRVDTDTCVYRFNVTPSAVS